MSNDNYIGAVTDLDDTSFYESEAAINPIANNFGAYVLFWINGVIQDLTPGFTFPDIHLWGNHNPADNTGWRFRLTDSAQSLVLQATVGDGAADQTASRIIDAAPSRLIMASMWFDGTLLSLGVNGALVDTMDTGIGGGPIAAGALARLGLSLAGDEPSGALVKIVSCGFTNLGAMVATTAGALAGTAFESARGAYDGTQIQPGADWARRYDAQTLVRTATAATITKSNRGAAPVAPPLAPAAWPDVGNTQFSAAEAASQGPAIDLARQIGEGATLLQFKNPDWVVEGFIAVPAPPP